MNGPQPGGAEGPARSPVMWVPTYALASGLPFYAVALIAGLMFKSLGVANAQITGWTGLLGLAWAFKPLWSPLLELAPSRKQVVVSCQAASACLFLLVALVAPGSAMFAGTLCLLAGVALCSATHDIAADGLYIASLSARQQAAFAGWLGAFFNAAKFVSLGGLVILAGWLERSMPVAQAWAVIFVLLAALMAALAAWHAWVLPLGRNARGTGGGAAALYRTLVDVLADFVRKPGIGLAIAFIILFRAGEGQVQSIGPLFLREARAAGGLGLTTDQVGLIYGSAGTLTFIAGSVLGGYFTAWRGLRQAMPVLILAMNLPNLAFWFLSSTQPQQFGVIAAALATEMFGYGFGFVGVMLFIMQVVAPGRYQTAHYALGTGIMQLGFVLFRMISGQLQQWLGYQVFFMAVVLAGLPVLLLARWLPLPGRAPAAGSSTAGP